MKTKKIKTKVKTIDINAKQWFDKVNGNSYFSVVVSINYGLPDVSYLKGHFQYGYGDCYRYAGIKLVQKQFPELKELQQYELTMQGIIIRSHIQTGCLKRDVVNYTR